MDVAFEKLNRARELVGCRIVRLDCHDELVSYYTSHGFKLITKNDDRSLNQMMTVIRPKTKKDSGKEEKLV